MQFPLQDKIKYILYNYNYMVYPLTRFYSIREYIMYNLLVYHKHYSLLHILYYINL